MNIFYRNSYKMITTKVIFRKWMTFFFISLSILTGSLNFAQNGIIGSGFTNGWGVGDIISFDAGAGSSRIKILNPRGSGNQFFRMVRNWSGDLNQFGPAGCVDVNWTNPGVIYGATTCNTAGAFFINCPNTTDNYVFKTPNGNTSTDMLYFRIQGAVRSVTSVSQSPAAASVPQNMPVTVTANLDGALSAGQAVYLRYTNNAFSTSTVVQMTGSGTSYSAQIPGNAASTGVSYYVFTSGTNNVSSNGSNADTYTINLNNNAGSNYNYTVAAASFVVSVTSSGGTAAAGAIYSTLKGAFDAINAGTHTGTINVRITGNTTEAATCALNASGSGSASYTAISIQPSGGGARTVSGAITAGLTLIDLNGADNVTIDGLNSGGNSLTISNTTASNSTGTSTIRFIGDASNNTITNCSVLGSHSAAVGTNGAVIFFSTGTTTGNDNNTISNCNIGPAGSNLPSKAIYGNGSTTSTAVGNSGITIDNNNIYDYFGAAVSSSGVAINGGCNAWSITNNRFYQTGTRTWTTGSTHRAIDLNSSTATSGVQGMTVTGNIIGFSSNTQTGTYTLTGSNGKFQGIFFNGITGGTISNINSNTIASVSLTGVTSNGSTSSAVPFAAISIASGLVTTNSNTIGSQSSATSLNFSTTTTSTTWVFAMYNVGSDDWQCNNNVIGGITATNLQTGTLGPIVFYGIRNNTVSAKTFTCSGNTIGGTSAGNISITTPVTSTSAFAQGIVNTVASGNISGNIIRNITTNVLGSTTSGASLIGICVTTTGENQTVSQNHIYGLNNTNTTAATIVTGIQFTGSTANIVERNLIYGLTTSTNSATAEVNGIRVAGGTTTYRNNMIVLGEGISNAIGAAASNTSQTGINGINEALGTNNFWHNSIYIGGTATAGSGASYAFNGTQTVNTRSFRNNIFFNARTNSGATGKHYAIKINGAPNPGGLTLNNNIYFTSGTGGVFGYASAADVANLAAWQTAVGQDANSYFSNPQFINPTAATPDLHINPNAASQVDASGAALSVTIDFDSQTRSSLTPEDIGADAYIAIPQITLSNNGTQVSSASVSPGTTNLVLHQSQLTNTSVASLTGMTCTTAGSYVSGDVTNLKAWYSTSATFSSGTATLMSTLTTPGTAGAKTFTFSSNQPIPVGASYIYITADISSNAVNNNTINLSALSTGDLIFASANKSGTTTAGGVQTFISSSAVIADNGTQIIASNITGGSINNVLHKSQITVSNATISLTGMTCTTAGTYASGDVTNLKVWYSTSSTFSTGSSILLSTLSTPGVAGSKTFSTFNSQALPVGTAYIYITTDLSSSATNGNTIQLNALTTSDFTFGSGAKSGTTTDGGVQTIIIPTVVLADNQTQITAAVVDAPATNLVLHKSQLSVSNTSANLIGLNCTTTGTYLSADVTNIKAWYSTSNTFNSGNGTLLSTFTTPGAAGLKTFPSFSAQSIPVGTGYIYLTVDISSTATNANTISVSALATTNFTFSAANTSGSTSVGGTQTLRRYCTSTGPAAQGTDHFTNFTITNGISNINNSTTYSTNGYGDFTSQAASQYPGSIVNFTMTSPGVGDGSSFGIFVDWNQDGDFADVNEPIFNTNGNVSVNPSSSFTVPSNALIGNTRMRIVVQDATAAVGSCNTQANGETEDYTFTVVAIPPCTTPISLAATASSSAQTTTTISGSFTAATSAPTGYLVVRTDVNTQPTPVTATSYTVGSNAIGFIEYVGTSAGSWTSSSLTPGATYYYWVFSFNNTTCAGGPVYSTSSTNFSATTVSCPGTALAGLTYSTNPVSYCLSAPITANAATLSATAGNVTYTVSPALPTGLTLNSSSGIVSGTPTAVLSAGDYTVTADNGCTQTSVALNITTLAIPTAPTSSAATNVSTYSFSANWTQNGASNYLLDVATDAAFTSLVNGYNGLNVGNVSTFSVTGLSASTPYWFRVRGSNGTCPSANSSSQTLTTTGVTSAATGNWNDGSTWVGGIVPTCSANVTIANGHNVTVNSASNVSKNLTISSGGALTVASGDLTVGCTLNNTPLTNNGTLTVNGGTLNVNGNVVCASTFNQSGGSIIIDGNNGGNTTGSVAAGNTMLSITSSALNLSGGTIIIVDPNAGSSGLAFDYNNGTHYNMPAGSTHTVQFGNGTSTDATAFSSGFRHSTYTGSGRFMFQNVVLNLGGTGNRNILTNSWTHGINGNLTIINGDYQTSSALTLAGNLVNNGIFSATSTFTLGTFVGGTVAASANAQTISGSGTFRNLTASPTASLTSLTVNNSNTTGVTISTPLSISGTLTMTAGKINTTATNLLTLGTSAAAGTLTYTAGLIDGPFRRTFPTSATATGVYDATTLFPVGIGTTYLPIHIDPVNAGGVVQLTGQAFNTNTGTAGTGVASSLSTDRWEALVSSGSGNLTNCFVGIYDADIANGRIITQSASANGIYNTITPTSTFVAAASPLPNGLRTATSIAAASYTGYFTHAAVGPVITSISPTNVCPNTQATITITGTNLGSATSVTLNGEACIVTGNTSTSITITTDASPQAGNIVVTTAANSATSPTSVSLFNLPVVTASSDDLDNTVCSGTSISLNGGGATSYAWNNSVTNNVAFTPIATTTYTVTGTDGNNCTNTATITITVNDAVSITTQPSSQVVLPNANATFTIVATGTGLTYQWQENTGSGWNNITDGGIYSGSTSNTLTLTGVTSTQDGYQYRVQVSGTAPCTAATSNAASLTISTTAISAHPQAQTICSNVGTASFNISTSGTTPTNYQWQVSTNSGSSWTDILGETTSSLSLSSLTISDNGNLYRCRLNSGSIASNPALLTVYDPPVIGTQPTDLTVCSNATTGGYSVSASGSNLTYQWQVSTDGGTSWSNVTGANVSGATATALSFSSFTNSMDGNKYRVIVSGSAPCTAVTSNEVTLNITGISITPSATTVCQNSALTLTVTPTASAPSLSYSWTSTAGSGANPTAVTGNPASITPTVAGSYTYTVTATGGGCSISGTQAITVNAISVGGTATASSSTFCQTGSTTITLTGNTGNIQWQSSTDNVTYNNIGGQTASTLSTGTISSTTYYQAVITNGVCAASNSTTATVTVNNPQVLTTTPGSICATSGTVNLAATASPGATLNWYAAATGGTALGTGSNYTTPAISATTSYHVEAFFPLSSSSNVGPLVTSTSCGTITNATNSDWPLRFNTTNFVNINRFDVHANSAGSYVFRLRRAFSSTDSLTFTVTLNSGVNTVNVNWLNIPSGSWQVTSTTANLRRITAANFTCSYPFTSSAGDFSIVGSSNSSTGNTATTYYNCFFNFNITESCKSPRTAVTATVTAPPSISASASSSTICSGQSTNLSVSSANNGYTYTWSNSLGNGASVSASPTSTTAYTVTATDNSGGASNGCSNTATVAVTVNQTPTAITINPSSASICNGQVQTLTASGGAVPNQTIISENFDNDAPTWTTTLTSGAAGTRFYYQSAPYTDASGSATFTNFTTSQGGKFVMGNADAGSSGVTSNTTLVSPVFSTVGYSSATLTFEHAFRSWSSDATVAVEISTNGGTTWTSLQSYLGTSVGTTTNSAQTTSNASINLGTYLNQSNLRLRFNYVSVWGYYWIIDNVNITGTGQSTFAWSSSPVGFSASGTSASVSPSTTTTYAVTATAANGCTNSNTVQVTVNQPSINISVNNTSIGDGDYLWNGNTSTDGSNASNWYVLNNGVYSVASTAPTSSTEVFIINYNDASTCVSNTNSANIPASGSFSSGNIYLGSNASMSLGTSSTLNVTGNFINDGTFTAGTGTVIMNGSSAQTIGGSAATTFNNLTVNNTSGVILNRSIDVSGVLNLSNGVLSLGDNNLTLGTGGTISVTSPSGSKMINTSGTGELRKRFSSSLSDQPLFVFPVGTTTDGNEYTPIELDFSSGTFNSQAYVGVRVVDQRSNFMSSAITNYVNRNWFVEPFGITSPNYDITLHYVQNDWIGNAGAESSVLPIKYSTSTGVGIWYQPDGGGFTNAETTGTGFGNSTQNFLNWQSVNSFSEFGGAEGNNQPLPVELTSFSASCEEDFVTLTWQTASEQNSSHFDIERSNDGENWRVIGTVSAAGNSTEEINYSFIDSEKSNVDNYYRLNQVDIDGKNEIYGPITISCGEEAKITTYPNPSKGEFNLVMYAKSSEKVTLKIIDGNSRVISTKVLEIQNGINLFPILENLSSGVYHIQLISESGKTTVLKHSVY